MKFDSKYKDYLTPKETASYLKVSTETVRQWANNGLLKAETTLGGHRRFSVGEVERFSATIKNSAQVNNKHPRVLIVDDDKQFVRLMEEILKTFSEKIEVDKAFDGFEAGHKVDIFKPTIVLLDLVMPNLNGIEVCRYLKNNELTSNIRIIATTWHNSEMNTINFKNAGAEAVLSKPFDHDELKDLILGDERSSLSG